MRRRKEHLVAGWLLTAAARRGFQRLGDVSLRRDFNLDRIVDMQEQVARILDSPLLIGNREVRVRTPMVRTDVRFGGDRDFVIRTVNAENPMDLYRGLSLSRYCALNAVWTKHNLRIALALQYVLMHFAVTRAVSSVAALSIHYDGP